MATKKTVNGDSFSAQLGMGLGILRSALSRGLMIAVLSEIFLAVPWLLAFGPASPRSGFAAIGAVAEAAETPYIPVGDARTKKSILAMPLMRAGNQVETALAKTLTETFVGDLNYMDLFKFLSATAFVEDAAKTGITPGSFPYADWKNVGADFLIKTALTFDSGKDILTLEAHFYDVANTKQVFAKKYITTKAGLKTLAHSFGNEVVTALTGLPGIFLTKIAMCCDVSGKKEIYMMSYDGSETKRVTHHHSLAFAPAWNPDNTKIAYSLFTRHAGNQKNIDLYEFDLTNNTVRMISDKTGINSGAAYSPDGNKLAATLSHSGTPSIYVIDRKTRVSTRLTHSLAFDVDPAFSPDGKTIAYVSSRTGMPMIFTMDAQGKNQTRLTFAGQFNATPAWSPRGQVLAFAGWLDKKFDIFTMNSDGTHIERLTKNQGGNEDPFFSPDGNFLAFSSNRTGQKNIYVMNTDGSFVKRLTYGLGNCTAPKWSSTTLPVAAMGTPVSPVSDDAPKANSVPAVKTVDL